MILVRFGDRETEDPHLLIQYYWHSAWWNFLAPIVAEVSPFDSGLCARL